MNEETYCDFVFLTFFQEVDDLLHRLQRFFRYYVIVCVLSAKKYSVDELS